MKKFRGVFPYLVTPLKETSEVATDVLETLCHDLVEKGVHGLTPLGSTGEYAYLTDAQRRTVVETVVRSADGRVPVVPGVASLTTLDAIRQAVLYETIGVDGIVLILDAYFPLAASEVEGYFRSVADAVSVPVIIYTNPNFQRTDLSVESLVRLSEHPRIVGVKDASTNTGRLLSILDQSNGALDIYAASSHIAACVMMIGGEGWFAGPACVFPEESVALYELCRQKRWDDALTVQRALWRFNEVFAKYRLAGCIKAALRAQGYKVGQTLLPQSGLSAWDQSHIVQTMNDVKASIRATGLLSVDKG